MKKDRSNLELGVWVLGLCVAGGAFYSGVPMLKAILILITVVVLALALGATRNKKGLIYKLVNVGALFVFLSVCGLSVAAMLIPCELKAVADALGISTAHCERFTQSEIRVKELAMKVDGVLAPNFERLDEAGRVSDEAALHLISDTPEITQQLSDIKDSELSPGFKIERRKALCNAEMMHADALRIKKAGEFLPQVDQSIAVCRKALQTTCEIWLRPVESDADTRLRAHMSRDNDCNKIRFFEGLALAMAISSDPSRYSRDELLSTICKIDLQYAESKNIFKSHELIEPALEDYSEGRNFLCSGFFGSCCG